MQSTAGGWRQTKRSGSLSRGGRKPSQVLARWKRDRGRKLVRPPSLAQSGRVLRCDGDDGVRDPDGVRV